MSAFIERLRHAIRSPRRSDTPVFASIAGLTDMTAPIDAGWRPDLHVDGSFLRFQPAVFYGSPQPLPFGAAPAFAARYPDRPFVLLSPIMFSHERVADAVGKAVLAWRFRRRFPRARLIVMANTEREERLLRGFGVDTVYAPQNMFIDENWYLPLPGRVRSADAIYNAQLAPMKRHGLARLLPSCLYVAYSPAVVGDDLRRDSVGRFLRDLPPGHRVLNRVQDGIFEPMRHADVTDAMASAHVGLCLSRIEGPMYASAEYLLAGLPVVSTPSLGGRDVFFHPDTTVIARPDPRDIRDAVAALKARAVPPDFVRSTTLRLIGRERDRFNAFIESLAGGTREGADPRWSFHYISKLKRHLSLQEFDDTYRAALDAGRPGKTGLPARAA